MENLESIMKMWEKDAIIDRLEPGNELLEVPKLHSKYLKELTQHRVTSRKINFDVLRLRKDKYEYYSGKMSKEDLHARGWEPFRLHVLKTDIGSYIDSDTDIIKLQEKKFYHDEVVSVLESIMAELKQRPWEIRSFIDWEKFVGGA